MSFCTEDPDTVNAINAENEDISETLARMRENVANGVYPKRYVEPFGAVWAPPAQPDVFSSRDDKWTQRFDHPKD